MGSHWIRRHLLYAGLAKEEYNDLSGEVIRQNHSQLTIYSMITMGILVVLALLAYSGSGFGGRNRVIYIAAAVVCILIAAASLHLPERHPGCVPWLVLCFEVILYALGIAVSVAHAELPGVAVIAFLLIVPLLFIDRPLLLGLKTIAAAAAFCLVSRAVKDPYVASADLYNTSVFSVAAVAIGIFITEMKMRLILQARRIAYLSETDLLTGLKNRNSYEQTLRLLPELCKHHIVCVYGDVNGLHELNNTKGHAEGDKMLQAVARAMRENLGADYLFRVGGDEFVSLQIDRDLPDQGIEGVLRDIGVFGYHMSFGDSRQTREELDITILIRRAEEKMYEAKREYYRQSGQPER